MMTNRKLAAFVRDDPPILVCADLQTEYLTEGRRHVIADAEAITSRCLELMTLWRGNLWPIIHLKRIAQRTSSATSLIASGFVVARMSVLAPEACH